ncbi:MAG: GTPase HflX [Flavobacteriales bacterium CG03_land_8_20_14_0_80_35_15]|nr:GTPase HflX [Zetaproteobacteria bacterium]OIO09609.1 MAG: GTPase HflX [Flavobacteriaceae bacterium CG1_02_35_72]PIR12283.1 MAG: GTPase HflX [Flavobacteriales bacterium CG11_big_fil_rev_8_21_14_0_20_35_7]PIV17093.1 MAG: GTPase HflX [Flavobacteriales bacterium CG03_land_8_20_14_0_80_35_15]PIX06616.1 MAG: GTPase HflX [Flavobacteriales bacterium CG_4_8_14_3_um_filter_35_10]PJA06126.1 MAG: GTPase HflX [Flavobacteriales bacterium CG_4_10_14_0_2_um_filter_35_18]
MIDKQIKAIEKAVLVGVITQNQNEEQSEEFLNELAFLTLTAGGEAVKRFTQKLDLPNPKTYLGIGKLEEISKYIKEQEVETVIFDDELSPAQFRNIEKILECKVIDRTNLILDIFAQRAQTSYARTQVEKAQCEYMLPRLTRLWTHLQKQKGGMGMRGPGETEIETDRRIIRDKIALLKEKLKTIDKQMAVQRKNRGKMVRVALVGYTNVGKSTLMNALSKSEVFAENKLFATLDTTVRKVVIKNIPFLVTDTVGFIRKLPTQLVESFKSTLDEVREADLLLHVVDISHPNFEAHIASVHQILADIKSADKPTILVFNKIDAYLPQTIDDDDLMTQKTKAHFTLKEWQNTWMNKLNGKCLFISALEKENFEILKESIFEAVKEIHITRFPYNDFLYQEFEQEV